MRLWPDLAQRSGERELMDRLDTSQEKLFRTLEQFRFINRLLTPCRRLFKHYFLPAMRMERHRKWTLLDIGAGGCDLAIWFTDLCRTSGIDIQITCLDIDHRVVQFARSKCGDIANIEIVESDMLSLRNGKRWDFVFANHFLHHLADEQIVEALRVIENVARQRFVISDIRRSHAVYFSYTVLAAVCLRDSFAFYDGRLSIRKGFTDRECAEWLQRSRLVARVQVRRSFPAHLVIAGEGNGQ